MSHVRLQRVDRIRECLLQGPHNAAMTEFQDLLVRAVVENQLVDLGRRHSEVRENGTEIAEAKVHGARHCLRSVASDEETIERPAQDLEEKGKLQLRKILHFINSATVNRRSCIRLMTKLLYDVETSVHPIEAMFLLTQLLVSREGLVDASTMLFEPWRQSLGHFAVLSERQMATVCVENAVRAFDVGLNFSPHKKGVARWRALLPQLWPETLHEEIIVHLGEQHAS
mmetsp:Transcript_54375/g.145109  ORF Transcript_54375/g.145109 Transcript_54375/m.145109 type:complete len:227 (+) Transcript_54375:516-1196(+)